ncbi:MAG: type II secretion system protein [Tepidisphaeraceae bacterium]
MSNRKSQIANRKSGGFTLVELLIVIGIIAVLISLLIPVVGIVKDRAREADTAALVASLAQACERYSTDFGGAYPGPFSNAQIEVTAQPVLVNVISPLPTNYAGSPNQSVTTGITGGRVTMAENLYLGLNGGLVINGAGAIVYDPSTCGQGPVNLNPLSPARKSAYYNNNPAELSNRVENNLTTGHFKDDAGQAYDSIIPEFVDKFQDKLPILYFRANRAVNYVNGTTAVNNNVVTAFANNAGVAPYDIAQNASYLGAIGANGQPVTIGIGRKTNYVGTSFSPADPHGLRAVNPANTNVVAATQNPIDAYAYFVDRNTLSTANDNRAKQKDSFILISAGRDRVYGTADDICSPNFGKVGQ